jgi:type VI secretion system secreted protein VgrG
MDVRLKRPITALHLDAAREIGFDIDIQDFRIEEALSTPFKCVVHFESADHDLPFDEIVGRGAAFSIETKHQGTRIWSGIVSEFELVNAQAEGTALPDSTRHSGSSTYRLVIRPALWRLSLRRNSRIFQRQTAVEIVKALLKDWDIEVDATRSLLKEEPHPHYEFRVQYDESDLDFFSRILEEAGITYHIAPGNAVPHKSKEKGAQLTKIVLEDLPQRKKALYGVGSEDEAKKEPRRVIGYVGPNSVGNHSYEAHLYRLSATQRPRPGKHVLRDFDFRGRADAPPEHQTVLKREGSAGPGSEENYEQYQYAPGAFWTEKQECGTLKSDDLGTARVDPKELERHSHRALGADVTGRTVISFRTNALDLEPGAVFAIGTDDVLDKRFKLHHPHQAFGPLVRLMVTHRVIEAETLKELQADGTLSVSHSRTTYLITDQAVFAEEPYRPARITPKPKVYGVQSAVVVGRAGDEVYTDEFGRVRVQFPWDREGQFNEKSSCWMRVSQAWAGGGFGFFALPRVGHEVLVGFFEGDPDQPIIVGRVHNATTALPYPTSSQDNWTVSGIRTDSSPHGKGPAGYNELRFQDKKGSEQIHIQAQNAFAIIAKNSESHDVGNSFTVTVGHKDGGANSTLIMGPDEIELRTSHAKLSLKGGHITLESDTSMCIHTGSGALHVTGQGDINMAAGKNVAISAQASMAIDTGGELNLNCGAPNAPGTPVVFASTNGVRKAHAGHNTQTHPLGGGHGGPVIPIPHHALPVPPGGFRDVEVGEEPEVEPAAAAAAALEEPDAAEDEGVDNAKVPAVSGAAAAAELGSAAQQAAAKVKELPAPLYKQLLEAAGLPPNLTDSTTAFFDTAKKYVGTTVDAALKGSTRAVISSLILGGGTAGLGAVFRNSLTVGLRDTVVGSLTDIGATPFDKAQDKAAAALGQVFQRTTAATEKVTTPAVKAAALSGTPGALKKVLTPQQLEAVAAAQAADRADPSGSGSE